MFKFIIHNISIVITCLLSFCFIQVPAQNKKNDNYSNIEPHKLSYDYINTLSNRADFFLGAGNCDKAIAIGEEKVAILRKLWGEDNIEYALSLAELGFYKSKKGEYDSAIEQVNKAIAIFNEKDFGETILFALISNQYSYYLAQIGNTKKSQKYKNEAKRIIKSILGVESVQEIIEAEPSNCFSNNTETKEAVAFQDYFYDYKLQQYDSVKFAVDTLFFNSMSYADNGDYSNAIKYCKETLSLLHKWTGEAYDKYRNVLIVLSNYYETSGNIEESYKVSKYCSELALKYYGEYSSEYAGSLSNYSFLIYKSGDYLKAVEIEQKAMDINSIIKDSIQYALSASNISLYYSTLGYLDKAIEYIKKALPILELNNHVSWPGALSILSGCYLKTGAYEQAIIFAERAISLVDKNTKNKEYYGFLSNLANCYYYIEDYEKAIALYEEVSVFEEKRSNGNSVFLSSILETLSNCYSKIGRIRDAIWNQEKVLNINKKIYGNDNIITAKSLSHLGYLHILVAENQEGIQMIEEAAQIIKAHNGIYNIDYINILRSLSLAYTDPEKISSLLEDAKTIMGKEDIGGISDIIAVYIDLAWSYARQGEKEKVIEIEKTITDNKAAINFWRANEIEHAKYLHKLSNCYSQLGEYEKSNEMEKRVIGIYNEKYGNDVSKYDDSILSMIVNYINLNDTTRLLQLIKETDYFDYCEKEFFSSLNNLSQKYRYGLWSIFKNTFESISILAAMTEDDYLISRSYDISALLSKSYLLKSEIKLSELIKKHGDESLQEKYKSYLNNKMRLSYVFNKNEEDSIIKIINIQEDELRHKIDDMGLLGLNKCSWTDIQAKMKGQDIAIEFLSVSDGTGGKFLIALLLKKEYAIPKLVKISPDSVLTKYFQGNEMDSLFITIWKPMEKELVGVQNVYFSPAGLIHILPIEYLKNRDGVYLNEKYNIYRVSTTQKILDNDIKAEYKKSILYGDLDYEYDKTSIQGSLTMDDSHYYPVDRGLRDLIMNRNGFERLVNTEGEIKDISHILSQYKINCSTFTGKNGIEESFKLLSGKTFDILHMSTHGMFIDKEKSAEQKHVNNLLFIKDEKSVPVPEDAALSRSFLVMSRGNMLPKHQTIPDGIDDGILTAQEIASLDFVGLDLVVLSACQTGLGDINSDGVFGLQRGFKKAGANTILMSLDKVDDEATKILMVEFYKNLMSGKTKHQSLKDAQKHLRQVDNGKYDDPKYWASFIMLDGLN